MNWWTPLLDVLALWLSSRKSIFKTLRVLERRVACQQEEIASLTRQRDAALDMIDRTAWEARHAMAVHRTGAESLRNNA